LSRGVLQKTCQVSLIFIFPTKYVIL
jgi:hypothetical protein